MAIKPVSKEQIKRIPKSCFNNFSMRSRPSIFAETPFLHTYFIYKHIIKNCRWFYCRIWKKASCMKNETIKYVEWLHGSMVHGSRATTSKSKTPSNILWCAAKQFKGISSWDTHIERCHCFVASFIAMNTHRHAQFHFNSNVPLNGWQNDVLREIV